MTSLVYLVPIALVAWFHRPRTTFAIVALAAISATSADVFVGARLSHWKLTLWNGVVELGVFVAFAWIVGRLRHRLDVETELRRSALDQLRHAERLNTVGKLASGLASKVIQKGTGKDHPKPEDFVKVHYTGWTKGGRMFDSSTTRNEPADFRLNEVIRGWTEGVALMVVGETDAISPEAEMREIAAGIPGARLIVVPGAGHMAPLERPEGVNPGLLEFLARL